MLSKHGGTPRFKVRLWADALPTYKNMRHWHNADGNTNPAAAAWRHLVGDQGCCHACLGAATPQQESRGHVFMRCPQAAPAHRAMITSITALWDEAGMGDVWDDINWFDDTTSNEWDPEWSYIGVVPATARALIIQKYTTDTARTAQGLLKGTVNIIMDTALVVWTQRNTPSHGRLPTTSQDGKCAPTAPGSKALGIRHTNGEGRNSPCMLSNLQGRNGA